MTEPTAEQVEAERGLVHSLGLNLCGFESWTMPGVHTIGCERTAAALARVRIEAHAAGRDEGLEAALNFAEEFDNDGRFSAWEAAIQICNAIRELRGRT